MRKPVAMPPNKVEEASCELNGGVQIVSRPPGGPGFEPGASRSWPVRRRVNPRRPVLRLETGSVAPWNIIASFRQNTDLAATHIYEDAREL